MLARLQRTRWGGVADGQFRPSQYFHIGQHDGIFWLVDPDGGRFLSKGVDTVRFDQDQIQHSERIPYAEACQRKYGNQIAWRKAVATRLTKWGFNTLGAWSDDAVASAVLTPLAISSNLDLGMSFVWEKSQQPDIQFPDVFDPGFDRHIRRRALELCGERRRDQNIIGWFTDNELRWGPDWRGPDEVLTLFLNLSGVSPGRIATLNWLRERYPNFTQFNSIWCTQATSWETFAALPHVAAPYRRAPPYARNLPEEKAANLADSRRAAFMADCDAFAAEVAERYFALTTSAIKAADPNHLVLGCRFAYVPSDDVIDSAGRHVSIVSFNCYEHDPSNSIAAYAPTGKPCLIGEFSFRAADSRLPNTNGAGPQVPTQTERAVCFRRYVAAALQKPTLVGYHWFEHADQPAEGRFDGENSNFGTVTIDDRIYDELTRAMTSVNGEAEHIHARTAEPTM